MARAFLYIVAGLVVLVLAGLLLLRIFADDLTEIAFVPDRAFTPQQALAEGAYADPAMWISRPGLGEADPARFLPEGVSADGEALGAAVFFVHPTSYFETANWNAPAGDAKTRKQAERFVRQMASPFNRSADLWAPRYRQATLGAFVTDRDDADKALALAYGDVLRAFDHFIETIAEDRPIVLAGHSQGAFHLRNLIAERVAGTSLQDRIAAAYLIGWPLSLERDVPALGLSACSGPDQPGCLVSWMSWADPASPGAIFEQYGYRGWLDGSKGEGRPFLCSNPLTGMATGDAPASANRGSIVRDKKSDAVSLVKGRIPARCGPDGLLLIGDPPELGEWVLPGNNYHVYDIPMFWMNLREDVSRRVEAWQAAR